MQAAQHRPTYIKVDLERIKANYQKVMSHLPQETRGIAVVKADAYGHGAVRVAQALEDQVDAFAVAVVDEGLELRQAGIQKDIIVLGVSPIEDLQLFVDADLGLTVTDLEWLKEARQHVHGQLKIHLKVDTGMSRIGLRTLEEIQGLVDEIAAHPMDFQLESIYTHMATADSSLDAHQDQVRQQYARFESVIQDLNLDQLKHQPYFHCANSATSLWYPNYSMDAVRIGLALYGLDPSNGDCTLPVDLEPALSLHTEIVYVKQMCGGESVSYGASYQAQKGEWIATLPIGYADGWQRRYGNKGYALVEGHACPFAGRICMDQCMIRLPRYYPPHTPVTLIGHQNGQVVHTEDIAQSCGTIPYEVVCLLSERVPVYY